MLGICSMLVPRPWLTAGRRQRFSRKAHDGKAHHLGAAASHSRAAGQARQAEGQSRWRRWRWAASAPRLPARKRQCPSAEVAAPWPTSMSSPTALGGRTDARGAAWARPTPTRMRDAGRDQDVDLGLLADQPCRTRRRRLAMSSTAKGPPAPPSTLARAAHSDQGEKHQRRRPAMR